MATQFLIFQIKYDGISGRIEFDNVGVRSNITIDVLSLSEDGLNAIGNWTVNTGLALYPSQQKYSRYTSDDYSLRNKSLTVITALAEPYAMLKELSEKLEGNDRFEGFAIDLIFELSLLLEFSYTFILQEDGNYGVCVNNITNEWNGMIGKVIAGVSRALAVPLGGCLPAIEHRAGLS